jgi:hypothetical protein
MFTGLFTSLLVFARTPVWLTKCQETKIRSRCLGDTPQTYGPQARNVEALENTIPLTAHGSMSEFLVHMHRGLSCIATG